MQPISYTGSTTSWARNENMTGKYYVYNVYTDFHKNFGSHYVQLLEVLTRNITDMAILQQKK